MPVRSPAFRSTFFCSDVLNPGAVTLTVYVAAFNAGRTNSPKLLVVIVYDSPVATSVMVTFALATTPPEESVIVPARVERSRCANAAHAQRHANRAIRSPVK